MSVKTKKICSGASPEQVAEDLQSLVRIQKEGIPLTELRRMINQQLLPHLMIYQKPEFHSLYNFFPERGAKMGAQIALDYNQGVTNWQVSPGGAMLEELCCQALCKLFHLSATADATFMYCGTYANQQALYLALHRMAEKQGFDLAQKGLMGFKHPERLCVIASVEAHFSLKHTLRMMGLGDHSLITVDVDVNRRMDMNHVLQRIKELKTQKEIFCIVSTAGTTSTGTIDPILPLVDITHQLDCWLHVDGAYGLAFSLLPERRHLFAGLEQADSVIWDPHKQFGVPIPNSVLFLKKKMDFERMAIYGEYFNRKDDPSPNPGLKSPPTTRPLSALPLVTTIRHQGLDKIKKRLRAPLKAIRQVIDALRNDREIEICHQPDSGLLCLRVIPSGLDGPELNRLQNLIFQAISQRGERSISISRLGDKTVLRLVAIDPVVSGEALLQTVKVIKSLAKNLSDKERQQA